MGKEKRGLWLAWGLWFHFWLVLLTALFGSLAILFTYLDATGKMAQQAARWWGRSLLRVAGIPVQVKGLEHLTPGETYVFAANHRSQFDIFVLFSTLPGLFLWVAKKELFQIPILGQALSRMGSIPVDRESRQDAIRSLDDAAAKIRGGSSMIIFPEGTRARTRELLPFKKGVFIMALKAGCPVVPVAISGTMTIQPRGALRLRPGPIKVVISPPLSPQRFRRKEDLIRAVRLVIAANFDPDYPLGPGGAYG